MKNGRCEKFKSLFRKLALLLVFSLVVIFLFGFSMGMEHSMNDMPKTNCIFGTINGCDMTLDQHLVFWQQFFTASLLDLRVELVVLVCLALVAGFATFFQRIVALLSLVRWRPPSFYRFRAVILRLFDYIFQLLRSGILKSKICQPVIL